MQYFYNIPEQITCLIQQYDLESSMLKNILNYINISKFDISQQQLNQYQLNYQKKFYIFNTLKENMLELYLNLNKINKSQVISWKLDYKNNELEIEVI